MNNLSFVSLVKPDRRRSLAGPACRRPQATNTTQRRLAIRHCRIHAVVQPGATVPAAAAGSQSRAEPQPNFSTTGPDNLVVLRLNHRCSSHSPGCMYPCSFHEYLCACFLKRPVYALSWASGWPSYMLHARPCRPRYKRHQTQCHTAKPYRGWWLSMQTPAA